MSKHLILKRVLQVQKIHDQTQHTTSQLKSPFWRLKSHRQSLRSRNLRKKLSICVTIKNGSPVFHIICTAYNSLVRTASVLHQEWMSWRDSFRGDLIMGSKAQLRNQIEQLSISRKTRGEIKDVFSQLQNILC